MPESIDPTSDRPVYRQIADQLRQAIRERLGLKVGDKASIRAGSCTPAASRCSSAPRMYRGPSRRARIRSSGTAVRVASTPTWPTWVTDPFALPSSLAAARGSDPRSLGRAEPGRT